MRIPDVNSAYPKGSYPTSWEVPTLTVAPPSAEAPDGLKNDVLQGQYPKTLESFDRGPDGLPDVNEHRMKFGVVIPSTNTVPTTPPCTLPIQSALILRHHDTVLWPHPGAVKVVEYDYWNMIFSNRHVKVPSVSPLPPAASPHFQRAQNAWELL